MKILIITSAISLVLSFVTDLIYNLIIMPIKKEMEQETEGPHNISPNDLEHYYHINKPMILREVTILNTIIEFGGNFFFVIFSLLFLIAAYMVKKSILWTLLCIPGLVFLYFILNLISVSLSRVIVQ